MSIIVTEALSKGASNAKTGRELAQLFNCNIRDVTIAIAEERRAGQPICAKANGKHAGYFLAETPEELEAYCKQLYHRGGELFKTRRALVKILDQLLKQREQEQREAMQE